MVEQVISSSAASARARFARAALPTGLRAGRSEARPECRRPQEALTKARTRMSSSLAANSVNVTAAMDLGGDASRQQHHDPARQNRCSCPIPAPAFDQERAVADRDGLAPRGIVGECKWPVRHHGASHTWVASPREWGVSRPDSFRTQYTAPALAGKGEGEGRSCFSPVSTPITAPPEARTGARAARRWPASVPSTASGSSSRKSRSSCG